LKEPSAFTKNAFLNHPVMIFEISSRAQIILRTPKSIAGEISFVKGIF
jgi:hypothetical protein